MVLLHSMLLLQECSYVGKGFFLSFFCQHIKEPLQDFPRIGMKRGVFAAFKIVLQWCIISITIPTLNLTGRNAVSQHLRDITIRHGNRYNFPPLPGYSIIQPVFVMMPVSSFMMKPCA